MQFNRNEKIYKSLFYKHSTQKTEAKELYSHKVHIGSPQ